MKRHLEDILIIDDEEDIRDLVAGHLEDEGYQPRRASGDKEALQSLAERQPHLVILDVWLTGSQMDGMQLLSYIRLHHPSSQIIMISGHATIDMAVKATRLGAYDFITKPFKSAELLLTVERGLAVGKLIQENLQLQQLTNQSGQKDLIGQSQAIRDIRQKISALAEGNGRCLIYGATGTGKSIVAGLIHRHSSRANGPFVHFSCNTQHGQDDDEARLFGQEAVGESPRQSGALEQAHGGSLFIDGVERLSEPLQRKLLKTLVGGQFQRKFGEVTVRVDARVIAASRTDLSQEVAEGKFLGDLRQRLAIFEIAMPSFQERKHDLAELARFFLMRSASLRGQSAPRLNGPVVVALQDYAWPNNGWEMANVMDRLFLSLPDGKSVIDMTDLQKAWLAWDEIDSHVTDKPHSEVIESKNETMEDKAKERRPIPKDRIVSFENALSLDWLSLPLREARDEFEKFYLRLQLNHYHHNISRTAEAIGLDRASLHRKLRSLDIE